MTSEEIYNIKQAYLQQKNNKEAENAFKAILNKTEQVKRKIENLLSSRDEFRKMLLELRNGNLSVMSEILGLNERGRNDSLYEDYLALDETNIIEIRFANHYETKDAALDKANNKAQYLYQVVLKTSSTKITDDSITNTTKVGNLCILTNGLLTQNSSAEKVEAMLGSIHDFLVSPSASYENAKPKEITKESKIYKNMKNVKRINESQLRAIVAESVKKVLTERDERSTVKQIIAPAYEEMQKAYGRLQQFLYKGNKDTQIHTAARILHDAIWAINDAWLYAPKNPGIDDEPDYLDGAGYEY